MMQMQQRADAQARALHYLLTLYFLLLTPYALADAQAPRHSIVTPNFLLLSRCAGPCLSLLSPYFLRPTPTPDS